MRGVEPVVVVDLIVVGAQGQEPALVEQGQARALLIGAGCELAAPTYAELLGITLSPHPQYLTVRSLALGECLLEPLERREP